MKTIYVSLSGGKDSTATLLLALEQPDAKVIPLFNDTGWEHPLTYDYLDYLSKTLDVKIERTEGNIVELIERYKQFPYGRGRFCTAGLKQKATYKFFKKQIIIGESECWVGIRLDESNNRRMKYKDVSSEVVEYRSVYTNAPNYVNDRIKLRLPILEWTRGDVFAYLEEKGIKPNPLYSMGQDRVGCFPCLLAGKKEQMRIFEGSDVGKERLAIIRDLEGRIGKKYEMYDTDQGSCEICKI